MRPEFPPVDVKAVEKHILSLEAAGKQVSTSTRVGHACAVCNRKVGPLAYVPMPGFIYCSEDSCLLTRAGAVTEAFVSPYGRCLDRSTLSIFSSTHDLPNGQVLVRLKPIMQRAKALAEAYGRLLTWQRAFDDYEHHFHPDDYERGIVEHIPPRRIEEVLVLRAWSEPVPRDPLDGLNPDIAWLLRRAYEDGPRGLEMPF